MSKRLNGRAAPEPEALVHEGSPLTERFPFRDLDTDVHEHDYDKQTVEEVLSEAVRAGTLASVVVLRLPMVMGPRDTARRFGDVLDRLDAGQTTLPKASVCARLTLVDVRDVAQAVALSVEQIDDGVHVFNVGEAEPLPTSAWAEALAETAGHDLTWLPAGDDDDCGLLGALPNDFVADTSRIRQALGYRDSRSVPQRAIDQVRTLRRTRYSESTRPRLVVVEGLPGAGKSTTVRTLAEALSARGRPSVSFAEGARDNPVGLPWSYDDADETVRRTTLSDYPLSSWARVPVAGFDTTVLDGKLLQNTSLFAMLTEQPREHWLALPVGALQQVSARALVVVLDVSEPRAYLRRTLRERLPVYPEWHRFVLDFFERQPYCRRRGWTGEEAFVEALADYWAWVRASLASLPVAVQVVRDPSRDWARTLQGLEDSLAGEGKA